MRKKSIKKIPLKPSFLRFWCKSSIGFVQGFENCAFWYRRHLKMLDGWPFREDFCVFHHLEHQWLPSWGAPMVPLGEPMVPLGEPMVPLLRWTNGSFVWVNQWLLCWGEPMAPLLGWTNGFAGAPPRPFGARWAGPPLPCVEWKYWKSSQEKASRKTTLYFLEKTFKMLWNLSS